MFLGIVELGVNAFNIFFGGEGSIDFTYSETHGDFDIGAFEGDNIVFDGFS